MYITSLEASKLHSTLVAFRPCSVYSQGKEPEKFFVSAGFALTHADSVTDVTAIEAVRVEELDEGAVSDGSSCKVSR